MNGCTSPFIVVDLITISDNMATIIPTKYIDSVMMSGLAIWNLVTIAPATEVSISNFALHEKKGITRIVAILSFSSARVLVLIMAGIEHPNPMIIGMKARPVTPNFLNILSRIKATLAIYPLSSRMEKNKNNIKICGKNPKTDKTPDKIPSPINPTAQGSAPADSNPVLAKSTKASNDILKKLVNIVPIDAIPPSANNPSYGVPTKEVTSTNPMA